MGLDIAAVKESNLINPEDKWNYPDEADFTYRDDPARLKRDCDAFDKLQENYEESLGQEENFHIGYGGFLFMRAELAKLLGFHYYTKGVGSPLDDYWLQMDREDSPEARLIQDFLLHSDCDGDMDSEHIRCLYDEMKNLTKKQLSKHDKLPEFYEFVKLSANDGLTWEFG